MQTAPSLPHARPRLEPKALAITIGLHVLLLLLCLLVRYQAPIVEPPAEELGMEVNLGTSADGSGDDQPEEPGDPASAAVSAGAGASNAPETRDMLPDDAPDAPEVSRPAPRPRPARANTPQQTQRPTRSTAGQQTTASTAQPAPRQRPKYIYNGSNGPGGNGAAGTRSGSSQGNTSGSGDRGVPGGTPGASNYEGSPGTGTGGIGHTLTGRRIIAPRLEGSFRNGGTVRVRVTVNRAGDIVNSSVISGTGELLALARQKLSQIRFSASPDGPVEQIGTLTFVFKTGN